MIAVTQFPLGIRVALSSTIWQMRRMLEPCYGWDIETIDPFYLVPMPRRQKILPCWGLICNLSGTWSCESPSVKPLVLSKIGLSGVSWHRRWKHSVVKGTMSVRNHSWPQICFNEPYWTKIIPFSVYEYRQFICEQMYTISNTCGQSSSGSRIDNSHSHP